MDRRLAAAKAAGYQAYLDGRSSRANPYTAQAAAFWLEGWHAAAGTLDAGDEDGEPVTTVFLPPGMAARLLSGPSRAA